LSIGVSSGLWHSRKFHFDIMQRAHKKSVRDPIQFETIAPRRSSASGGQPHKNRRIAEIEMTREVTHGTHPSPAASLVAVALGAAAVGAVAIGALAIGRLAVNRLTVNRLTVRKAQFGSLEVDELTVRRLRVVELQSPKP
jgi:hypothetical protein